MNNVLIDTDVILDFFFDRKPHSDYAASILSLCESKEINGYVTPVILSNLYYLLRQTATHERVIGKLSQLVFITEVLTINKNSILQALNSDFKDFEDALQNFSAENDGRIDIILTRNLKDYRYSNLSVMTPDGYWKAIVTGNKQS